MIIDGNKELQQKVKELLDGAEDKSAAIYEAAEMIINAKHDTLIKELVEQNARAAADESYRKSLGLHTLSKEESEFYEKVKGGVYQAITAKQSCTFSEQSPHIRGEKKTKMLMAS